jgi:dihydroorotate dehydrogenase (fumarate)
MSLSSTYLGIPVKSPVIVGSCGLTSTVDHVIQMAENGAGAVVLKSIFEEEIILDYEKNVLPQLGPMNNDLEFFDYYDYQIKNEVLEKYRQLILDVKKKTNIPIIASINCINSGEWFSFAKKLEAAGADAIELNIFKLPYDPNHSSIEIENLYLQIIKKVQAIVSIPISVKIGSYFSNLGEFVKRLSLSGVNGIVLFNRYFSLDIDIDREEIISAGVYSNPQDIIMPLRWISILSGKVDCELIGSTGVHSAESAIKMLLAGADSVQVVSSIYKNGPQYIQTINKGIAEWMKQKGYAKISDFRGNLSQTSADKPELFERVQFMRYFSDHVVTES